MHQKPLTVGIKEQKLFHCLPLEDPEGLNNRGNLYTDDSLQRSKHFKLQKLFIYIFMTVCKAIAWMRQTLGPFISGKIRRVLNFLV